MLLLPITMAVMGVSVLTPVVHLLLAHFKGVPNYEYLVMGGVVTMPSIWVLLMSAPAGWVADRFGRRKVLILSMIVYAFVGVAPAFLEDLNAIIVSRIGVGICEAIVMTVTTTMIGDYFQGHARERWLASQTAVASVAAIGITYLGGRLGALYGWRGPFYLYLYSLLLVVGVVKLVWEPGGEEEPAAPGTAPASEQYTQFPWARLCGICAVTLLGSISFYTVITKNAEALVALGVSDPAGIGALSAIATIGVPVGTFIYWGLSRLPIPWLLFVDFALIGLGFSFMGRATDPTAYVWGSFINQVGCGLVLAQPAGVGHARSGIRHPRKGHRHVDCRLHHRSVPERNDHYRPQQTARRPAADPIGHGEPESRGRGDGGRGGIDPSHECFEEKRVEYL